MYNIFDDNIDDKCRTVEKPELLKRIEFVAEMRMPMPGTYSHGYKIVLRYCQGSDMVFRWIKLMIVTGICYAVEMPLVRNNCEIGQREIVSPGHSFIDND
jgi:hypothetical protein